jgi:hypothetical protein
MEIAKPRMGRKKNTVLLLSPLRGSFCYPFIPTARAMGYRLPPFHG